MPIEPNTGDWVPEKRPNLTWRCDKCGVEFDYFTYGGPCVETGCDGELQHKKPKPGAPQGPVRWP